MDQELELLKKLLTTTFSGSSTEEIKQAEDKLRLAAQNPTFLNYIVQILKENSNTSNKQLELSCSNYINVYVKSLVNSKFNTQSLNQTAEQIILIIRETNISIASKQITAKGLATLLCFDQSNELKNKLYILSAQWMTSDQTPQQQTSTFVILQSLIISCSNVELLKPFFEVVLQPFCTLGTIKLTEVSSCIQAFNNQENQQENLQKALTTLQVLQEWANVLRDFIHKIMDAKKHDMIIIILSNDILASMICHGICLCLQNEQQLKDCLISTSSIQNFDDSLNELKTSLLKTYSRVIKQMLGERSKYNDLTQRSQFYILSSQILPVVIKGLVVFCQSPKNTDSVLENRQLSHLLIESLKYLCNCAEQTEFYQFFQESGRILLLEVIFPLLGTSSQEQENFYNNPEEYVKLSLDTCDRQMSYTYKCSAAKLLEAICDYIDGFETIVTLLLLQIMNASITCDSIETMITQFPALSIFQNTVFLSKCSREKRIDTALVGLSILSYLTPKRTDIVNQIELIFKNQMHFFLNKDLNPIIKSRVCLMLGYYTDTIFQNDNDIQYYLQLLNFLINCLQLKGEENLAIVYQSIDSLQNIYDDDGQVNRVKQNINEVFSTILQLVISMKHNQFFEIIFHIIKYHVDQLTQQNIILCVKELSQRIIIETQSSEINQVQDRIIVNKSCNILRHMSENQKLMPQYIDPILQELKPMLQYVQYPDKIDFDEDIILLIGSFVKHSKQVHPICHETISYFPGIFEKQQQILGQLNQTYNYLIIYGKEYLLQNIQILQQLIEISFKTLLTQNSKSNDADKAQGATLLQLVMQNLGDRLPEQFWKVIFENTVRFFQENNKFKHYFIYGRTAGIFLSGFYSNVHMCYNVLEIMGIFSQVIDLLVSKLEYYKRTYDVKIFIIGMSKVIEQLNLDNNKLLKILDCLITLLNQQKNSELKSQKKSKRLNEQDDYDSCCDDDDGFDDDEDDEDDDDDEYDENNDGDDEQDEVYNQNNQKDQNNLEYDSSIDQDKIMIKDLISPVTNEDEFNFFKTQIFIMRQKNQAALQQLFSQLNNEKQEFLKGLLSVQRIKVGDEHVVRVIRKYRRKN